MKKLFDLAKEERERIVTIALSEVKKRYVRSVLGVFWTLLEPLATILIYSLIFPLLLKSSFYEWVIFFLAGFIPYRFLSRGSIETTTCLIDYQSLQEKIKIEPEVIVLSRLLANIIYFLVEIGIFFPIIFFVGAFGIKILFLPILIVTTILFVLSFGFLLSHKCKKYRDVEYILRVFFELFFFLSPIVYRVELIPESWRIFYILLPFSSLIYSYQTIFFEKLPTFREIYPLSYTLIYSLLFSIVLSIISYKIFTKEKKHEM
jgi:ABC-type polysaccharide/polyol phosphate export permease